MRFDYYQATIPGDVAHSLAVLEALGDQRKPAPGLAKMYRYDDGYAVFKEGRGPVAHVFSGGQNDTVHVFASGEDTQALEGLLREHLPGHLVTRADAAQDFNDPTAYDRLRAQCMAVAQRRRLSFKQYVDELDPQAGRTQYMGSPSSDCRVRVYEKGWEVFSKLRAAGVGGSDVRILNPATGELVQPANWARAEAQVRPPDARGRAWLASASPVEVWGASPWLKDVGEQVLGLDLERFVMRRRRHTNNERALAVMASQYAAAIRFKVEELGGDWGEFGRYLQQELAEQARLRRMGVVL